MQTIQRGSIQNLTAKSRTIARLIGELGTLPPYLPLQASYAVVLGEQQLARFHQLLQIPKSHVDGSSGVLQSRHVWLNLGEEDALRCSLFVQKYADTTSIVPSHAADVAQIPDFPCFDVLLYVLFLTISAREDGDFQP